MLAVALGIHAVFWIVAGVVAGAAFAAFAARHGRRGELRVLAWGLFVAALIYVAFGGWAGGSWWLIESVGLLLYGGMAWRGLRGDPRWLAWGWALHVLWDVGLHWGSSPGAGVAPLWYVQACIGFDLVVAARILTLGRATSFRVARIGEPNPSSGVEGSG